MIHPVMRLIGRLCIIGILGTIPALVGSASALAHSGEFSKFNYCPSTNEEVKKCLDSVTVGGKIILGKKTTPIVNDVTLQGGYGKANSETHISKFYEATNGITLSKTPQPVPGGLAGLINCKEISNIVARVACELALEGPLTGVNATLELAKPANEIQISEYNLLVEEGLALQLPVKIHLENPFLGSSCYVGSSSDPIIWNLTSGATEPPAPYETIHGTSGVLTSTEEDEIATLTGNELVDNTWAAPGANGCDEPLSAAVDPIINLVLGLPSSPGENTAILINNIAAASAAGVNTH
jgi:hypothetical protein